MSSAMLRVNISGAQVTLKSSYTGVPIIGTFSSGSAGPLGATGPTTISAHLALPVWDSVVLWLDAADFATIGLSATTGAGGFSQVSAWYDKSSNVQHLSQATAANQPYYHPTGFNNKPGIRFGYNSGVAGTTVLSRTGPFLTGSPAVSCFFALIASISGLIPTILITRLRLYTKKCITDSHFTFPVRLCRKYV